MTTFETVYKAADKTGSDFGSVGYAVNEIIASAECNAYDTIAEGADKSEFDAIALSSLSDILADSTNSAAGAWFTSQGVRF